MGKKRVKKEQSYSSRDLGGGLKIVNEEVLYEKMETSFLDKIRR